MIAKRIIIRLALGGKVKVTIYRVVNDFTVYIYRSVTFHDGRRDSFECICFVLRRWRGASCLNISVLFLRKHSFGPSAHILSAHC